MLGVSGLTLRVNEFRKVVSAQTFEITIVYSTAFVRLRVDDGQLLEFATQKALELKVDEMLSVAV